MKLKEFGIDLSKEFFVIAGPCVIESEEHARFMARELAAICQSFSVPFVFKASYDKANRTSLSSFRGPGITRGLEILQAIRADIDVPVLSDVHEAGDIEQAARVLDVIQIPAFLCRQTDLLLTAAASGRVVNVKKGQFLSPWDAKNIIDKFETAGFPKPLITERGASFGYNNLVVDFRSFQVMREWTRVVFDVTHSVQIPGGAILRSGGAPEFIPMLARAGAAAGVDGFFFEVHDHPEVAKSDGANALRLPDFPALLKSILKIRSAASD
jgi:2-dehydro-3-deoxyphosphooctonate aldolase (KDO 8-P synthase)